MNSQLSQQKEVIIKCIKLLFLPYAASVEHLTFILIEKVWVLIFLDRVKIWHLLVDFCIRFFLTVENIALGFIRQQEIQKQHQKLCSLHKNPQFTEEKTEVQSNDSHCYILYTVMHHFFNPPKRERFITLLLTHELLSNSCKGHGGVPQGSHSPVGNRNIELTQ